MTSWETGPSAWTGQETKLKALYELSDKRHRLVAGPESADIILICDVRADRPPSQFGQEVRSHELLRTYPYNSFSLSHAEVPLILHHGIYTNGVKSLFNLGRVRTGSFTAHIDKYLNPYVRAHRVQDGVTVRKEYLLVFIGRTYPTAEWNARNTIFNLRFERADVVVENSTSFELWSEARDPVETLKRQKRFYDTLLRAKFSLCPRGSGASMIRLFESIQLGVAPVIISDAWILPRGPRWEDFSIILKERDAAHVEKIVQAHEAAYKEMGALARHAFERYFAEDVYFNYVVDNCLDIARSQMIPEGVCWRLAPMIVGLLQAKDAYRAAVLEMRNAARSAGRRLRSIARRAFRP